MQDATDQRRTPPRTAALAALALLGVASAGGCQSFKNMKTNTYDAMRSLVTSSYKDADADKKLADAMAKFDAGAFDAAEPIFADLAENTQNPAILSEKARFHEAECQRNLGKLPTAAATYHRLLKDYPFGAYRERCCTQMYAIAYDWLDEGTLKQIEAEREGVKPAWWESLNPGVNAFDKRKPLFDTEGEALRVLDNVQTHDGIGPNADRALFWLGYVHYYRGRFDEADHYFSQLVELHKDSKLRDQAMELAIVSKHNATGGAVYDSGKASEALNLIHQAQATIPEFTKDPEKRAMMERQKVAVRMQLATKYVEYGRYYERTGHPGSAYFYYDLVRRQHPGTKPADYAAGRMAALEPLRAKAEADRAAGIKPKRSWFQRAGDEWDSVVYGRQDYAEEAPYVPPEVPGPWADPKGLPASVTGQQ